MTVPAPVVITGPAANTTVGTSFMLTGTAEPNTFLQIKATTTGGSFVNVFTTSAPDGTWSSSVNSPTPPIASGFDVQVKESLPNGVLLPSNILHLTNYATVAPTITSPADGAVVGQSFAMSGTGIPEAVVTVSKSTAGGSFSFQGTSIVQADGTWSFTFTSGTPLPVDGLDLRAVQRMKPDGFFTPDGPPSNVVHVGPPVVQCLPGTYSATGNAPCTTASPGYYVPNSGAIMQIACPVGMTSTADRTACIPIPAPSAPTFLRPTNNQTLGEFFEVLGAGVPGATVTLTVNVGGNPVETHTFPNINGNWGKNLISPRPVSDQGFDLVATQTVPGNPTPSASTTVHVTNIFPAPVVIAPVSGQLVGATTFVVSGIGIAGTEVIINVPGQNSTIFTVSLDGAWSVTVNSPNGQNVNGFDVTVGQRAWFTASSPLVFLPFVSAPPIHVTSWAPAPVITSPAPESVIAGASFPVTGTGVPGYSINVHVNGVPTGINPTVGADGTWNALVPVPTYSPGGFFLNARQWSTVPDTYGAFSEQIHLVGTAPARCDPGYFSPSGTVPCTPAPLGSYVPTAGAIAPSMCPAGTYTDALGSVACTPAPAGYFVPRPGGSFATPWTVCGPNEYVATPGTATTDVVCAPKLATSTSVTFGAGPFPAKGSAYTATASVSPAAAGAATIVYSGDCVNPGTSCTATASYAGNATYAPSSGSASITIVAVSSSTYRVCAVHGDRDDDEDDDRGGSRSKGHESGSTVSVKVRVCNEQGRNVGSRSLVVKAVGISPTGALADSGRSNPGNLFRFDDGVYQFNLSTKGLTPGTYTLDFTIGTDPTVQHYSFTVRPEKVGTNNGKGDDRGGKGDDKGGKKDR